MHILMFVLNFFKRLSERYEVEALVYILYDTIHRKYTLRVPKQELTAVSVDSVMEEDYPDYLIHVMEYSKKAPVKIVVLGAGGTGGYVIPHLYRLGYASEHPTRILVCDGDVVEQKNLIRQNFVEQDIGRNKAQVLAERYAAAFGIECEYRPEFIETQEELYTLTEPDRVPYPMEPQRVILLGCVDNNKSRQLCHRVFEQKRNLIYIDAGNGEHTGQVVCGVRQNGRTLYKPVCSLYPDLLEVVSFLYDLLIAGNLKTRYVTFSSRLISMRAEVVRQRPKKTTAKAA